MPRRLPAAILFVLIAAPLSGCLHASAPVVGGKACLADLDSRGVVYRTAETPEPTDGTCGIDTAVKISRLQVALKQPATMSCKLAVRLDMFEENAVQKYALSDLGKRVVRIDHLGAYSCRRNTGRRDRLSQHAYGMAIDISAFRLSDGTTISVEHDWSTPGPKRDFLYHLAHAACGYFSVVLTPSSNADHYNHFHLDIGPDRVCSV